MKPFSAKKACSDAENTNSWPQSRQTSVSSSYMVGKPPSNCHPYRCLEVICFHGFAPVSRRRSCDNQREIRTLDSWLGCREYYNTVCGKCTDLLENYFRPVFKGNHGRKKILVVSIFSHNPHQKNHNIAYRLFFDFLSSIIIDKTRTIGAIRKKEYEHDRKLSGFGTSSARCPQSEASNAGAAGGEGRHFLVFHGAHRARHAHCQHRYAGFRLQRAVSVAMSAAGRESVRKRGGFPLYQR